MYAFIKGKVAYLTESEIVVETNGVGYALVASSTTLTSAKVGETVMYPTYLQVREDALTLYGFGSAQEKEMFLHLISVTGVGCKLAIGILSGASAYDLALAIATSDIKALSKIKGVGKKTAEHIALDLKEKISAIAPDAATEIPVSGNIADAVLALQTLGFTKGEAVAAVSRVVGAESMTLDELVSKSLRAMK